MYEEWGTNIAVMLHAVVVTAVSQISVLCTTVT